jgi:hypothetical protein
LSHLSWTREYMSTVPNSHNCTTCGRNGFIWRNKEHADSCTQWFKVHNSVKREERRPLFLRHMQPLQLMPEVLEVLVWDYFEPRVPPAMFLTAYKQEGDYFRFTTLRTWEPTLLGAWVEEKEVGWNEQESWTVWRRLHLLCYFCRRKISSRTPSRTKRAVDEIHG